MNPRNRKEAHSAAEARNRRKDALAWPLNHGLERIALSAMTLAALACINELPAQADCVPAPAGLVGWWSGDGHTLDLAGTRNGVLRNGASYASQIGERQLAPLVEFCNFINRMEERVPREPAGELLNDLLKTIDYEVYLFDQDDQRAAQNKWNNVLEFAAWIAKKGEEDEKDLLQLTQTIALITLLEGREEEEPDAVRLSTLHAAKGLEFGHVFLVGVEENILPHRDAVDEGRLEEERRLMYVGVTRAKKSLTLSYCSRRKRARETVACDPSRFIDELGDDVRMPEKPSSADAKASGSDRLAALKAMLG